jgi:hypothetical protein
MVFGFYRLNGQVIRLGGRSFGSCDPKIFLLFNNNNNNDLLKMPGPYGLMGIAGSKKYVEKRKSDHVTFIFSGFFDPPKNNRKKKAAMRRSCECCNAFM